jgi:hypothetical protein
MRYAELGGIEAYLLTEIDLGTGGLFGSIDYLLKIEAALMFS